MLRSNNSISQSLSNTLNTKTPTKNYSPKNRIPLPKAPSHPLSLSLKPPSTNNPLNPRTTNNLASTNNLISSNSKAASNRSKTKSPPKNTNKTTVTVAASTFISQDAKSNIRQRGEKRVNRKIRWSLFLLILKIKYRS